MMCCDHFKNTLYVQRTNQCLLTISEYLLSIFRKMSEGDQLHLNWNNFGDNLINLVKEFRDDKDFHDVTLLCEDGVMIPANKFLMSCCSSFFKFVFKRTLQANVVIYLKGVKGNHMESILDFIYHGYTNVNENQLSTFLQSANDLKISGLVENTREKSPEDLNLRESDTGIEISDSIHIDSSCEIKSEIPNQPSPQSMKTEEMKHEDLLKTSYYSELEPSKSLNCTVNSEAKKYLENCKQREKRHSGNASYYFCKFCGKSFAYKHVLENHVETHMDNSYPCGVCQKNFKTKNSLKSHLSQRHRNGPQSTPSKA